jgi:ABC-2 type transport system ATP-binding protein
VAEVRGISGAARTAAITAAVDRTSLGTVFEQRIETLSKGFRRRVGLAQALLHDPEILILDEPTDGLDPNQKHEVRSLIKEMRDKCIILSTHILEEVDAVCNRAVIVSQGAIVADDTPEGLRSRAREGAHVRYTVSSGPADAVETFLASLPGVRSLKRQNRLDTTVFSVEAESGVSLDSRIFFEESLRRNWGLSEFTAFDGGLDAVFREITQSSGQRSE